MLIPRRSLLGWAFTFLLCGVAPLALPGLTSSVQAQEELRSEYRSPYRVEFTRPREELIADLLHTERGNPRLEAEVPHEEWYSRRVRERWGSWGPVARMYPPAEGVDSWPVEALRERVVATALRFVGFGYQHHHIPGWDPPREWSWKQTCVGHNGRGVDCSNFTGFVYNQGFGIRLNTAVGHQAEQREVEGPGLGRMTTLEEIRLPEAYQDRINTLKTGDLLFIRSDKGEVSHVVIWIGEIGRSPDGAPLILDSHGAGVKDSEGNDIPCGIHLRPFRETSWYNHDADHALRVFRE